jgi:hypothetical protein
MSGDRGQSVTRLRRGLCQALIELRDPEINE